MGVVTATITNEAGTPMEPDYELLYIDITKEFNKLPTAEIKFIDGDITKNEFKVMDSEFFTLGNKIKIALKFESEPKTAGPVFEGVVVNHALELDKYGSSFTVDLCDECIKMTTVRNNMVHKDKKDSEIIEAVIKNSGVLKEKVEATTLVYPEMVQYYCSDWDFMLTRAEANGHLVIAKDGKISTVKPTIAAADLTLELGKDSIYDFDLHADSRQQVQDVESVAWDMKTHKLSKASKSTDFELAQGKEDTKAIATSIGSATSTLVNVVDIEAAETKAWADAQIIKSRLSLFRGWIKISGNAKLEVGNVIEIKGVGDRFTGKNLITAVRHQVSISGWQTHIQIGMDANWFSSQSGIVDSKAAGLLPGVNGLQVGVIVAFEKDPRSEFRVKVNIPAFNKTDGIVWARLTSIDSGKERGVFFQPEVGDEVVVGFMNDDPRQAIILGSVHSSKNPPPIMPADPNIQKGIITKKKFQLLFDEKDDIITLSTSEENKITIDEKKGAIQILDANQNLINLDSEGIYMMDTNGNELFINGSGILISDLEGNEVEMASSGITLNSGGDLTIKTGGDFNVEASGNVEIKGSKVDII